MVDGKKKVPQDRLYLQPTNYSCGFSFDGSEASISVFAISADEATKVLLSLLAFKNIRDCLGEFETEVPKIRKKVIRKSRWD
jgi:hypothetical protein